MTWINWNKILLKQTTIQYLWMETLARTNKCLYFVPTPCSAKIEILSVENVKAAYTEGVLQRLRIAFERIGINNPEDSIVGLNVNGASVNNGRERGLWMLIKQNAPWLELQPLVKISPERHLS